MKDEIKSEVSICRYLHHADAGCVDSVQPRTHADGSADPNNRAGLDGDPYSDSHPCTHSPRDASAHANSGAHSYPDTGAYRNRRTHTHSNPGAPSYPRVGHASGL